MSASEALTIWMLSTAMKAPSVAPAMAIQVLAETAGAGVVTDRSSSPAGTASMAGCSVVMVVCSSLAREALLNGLSGRRQPPGTRVHSTARLGALRCETLFAFAFGDRHRSGVDGRLG